MAKLLAMDDVREAANILVFPTGASSSRLRIAGISHDFRVVAILTRPISQRTRSAHRLAGDRSRDVDARPAIARRRRRRAGLYGRRWICARAGASTGSVSCRSTRMPCTRPGSVPRTRPNGPGSASATGPGQRVQRHRRHVERPGHLATFRSRRGRIAERRRDRRAVELADRPCARPASRGPRIAVAALNPHAGDGGNIGREEIDIIAPAVDKARALQIAVRRAVPVRHAVYQGARRPVRLRGQHVSRPGPDRDQAARFHMGVSVLSAAALPDGDARPRHRVRHRRPNKANVEPRAGHS